MRNRDLPDRSTSNGEPNISSERVTVLKPEDYAVFLAAMDNPPATTMALREALARHRERVIADHQSSEADVQSPSLDFPRSRR